MSCPASLAPSIKASARAAVVPFLCGLPVMTTICTSGSFYTFWLVPLSPYAGNAHDGRSHFQIHSFHFICSRKSFSSWLCHSVWLFHLHSTVKRQPFSPVFPLAESIAEAFFWLFLWNFKEKSINHFLGHNLPVYQDAGTPACLRDPHEMFRCLWAATSSSRSHRKPCDVPGMMFRALGPAARS